MKKIFTLIICFLSLHVVKAAPLFIPAVINSVQQGAPDTIIVPDVAHPAPLTYQSGIYKRRLDSIKKDVPLDYNEYVQSYIDIYAHNRDEMGHVLGLTKYYFPIYEKAFRDAGIPDEIKYLSIVESKLDPYAVSRVGATGPWQFMFTTGKLYGLNINDYVDDRRDPIQASYAAAAYLKDAYEEFGDWLLAIASYNCGKNNVEHAIDKAGGATDFWSIRQYLPAETRGYVPAYIAVTYLMNYYSKHNIVPQPCTYSLKTDTVLVNNYVSLSTVAQVLNVDIRELAMLNPAYKKQVINGTPTEPRRLVIPPVEKAKFGALYEALNNANNPSPAPRIAYAPYQEIKPQRIETSSKRRRSSNYITYKVKSGDTLSGIVSKFEGASIERIKSLNGLKKNRLQPGMTIKIDRI